MKQTHRLLVALALSLAVVATACDGNDQPVQPVDRQDARETAPADDNDETVLADGVGGEGSWRIVVTRGEDGLCVTLHELRGPGSVCDYSEDPPTLDETHAWLVEDDDELVTFVFGPVVDDAERVEVVTGEGERVDSDLRDVEGVRLHVARIPGRQIVEEVIAYDADGDELDRRTLPAAPPLNDRGEQPDAGV